MKNKIMFCIFAVAMLTVQSCAAQAGQAEKTGQTAQAGEQEKKTMRVKITAGKQEMIAVFEDNELAKELIKRMPFTIPMKDLYDRELCYHYGAGTFPVGQLRSDGYKVGDIIYWPPRGNLVILYKQNGEKFERQQVGHIISGVEFFETSGDIKVTFELTN